MDSRRIEAGITLIEMLVVVAVISVMVGITFPTVASGLDSIRLSSASNSTASFLTAALSMADRRQTMVQLTVIPQENRLELRSPVPGSDRDLTIDEGIRITGVLPGIPGYQGGPRSVYLVPGGTAPRIGVVLTSSRGAARIVQVDPIMGLPKITRVDPEVAQ